MLPNHWWTARRYPLKWVFVSAWCCQIPVILLAASASGIPLVGIAILMVLLLNGSAPAESALFARYSPSRWRATAFGVKFVVALGVSALGVPLVARIHDQTGGFYWLFIVLVALAATIALVALALPRERTARALILGRSYGRDSLLDSPLDPLLDPPWPRGRNAAFLSLAPVLVDA